MSILKKIGYGIAGFLGFIGVILLAIIGIVVQIGIPVAIIAGAIYAAIWVLQYTGVL